MADAQAFIVDTDCGIDDAVALMILLSSPEARLVGVTTVSGNVGVEQVTENVRRLLSYFGRADIPVYPGASHALLQDVVRAEGVHGANGLGGVELPAVDGPRTGAAAPRALAELVAANPGATLVTLGPMTNLAMALNLHPEMRHGIGRFVAMGGAIETGNITRFAEFNFYADPEAVQFVLTSELHIDLVPWDACVKHRFNREEVDAFHIPSGPAAELFHALQDFVFRRTEHIYGVPFAVHPDPMAMAYAIQPEIATERRITGLRMELNAGTLRGASVRAEGENVTAIMDIDVGAYVAVLRRIGSLQVTRSAFGGSSG
jgi:inosine-uridine nucleoside N-ribohydrolase